MNYVGHPAKRVKHLFQGTTIEVAAIYNVLFQVMPRTIRVMQRVLVASACRLVGAAVDLQPADRADARNFYV
ncbi:hypothetical protein CRT60_06895 [Azospirillum palustre]|uniref:Uncharacterized protein n=1 Tax=Azospirillum palustre TaxID=2044885 RepID=A0A2B8BIJ8_9PROT|nr:hypothetical protein CRT60_06895 [Azospirillum palustre]